MIARVILVLFFVCSLMATHIAPAGRPLPPQRQPQGRRDANLKLLQFQNALAAARWDDALSLCSTNVQSDAKAWPDLEQFFRDTVPIEHVLARDFGCSSCGDKFYGMFETISAYGELPRIDWYWGLALAENGKWLVDYPPVRLSEYAAQRRAALQARDEKTAALRQSLESKMPFLSTRLIPLTNKFRIGQPMPFRVELTNAGATAIHYVVGGLNHYGLVVRDERRGTVLTNTAGPVQVAVRTMELPARSAVVLAEALDITRNHNLTAPGKYSVQFDGRTLEVGARVPGEEMDRFGRPLGDETSQASFDRVAYQVIHKTAAEHLFAVTNKFPSNVVRIDVRR